MNRTLARLVGWSVGYLAVVLLERVAYRAGIADTAAAVSGSPTVGDEDLADARDVVAVVIANVADSPCVCCRSGAAVPPQGAAR